MRIGLLSDTHGFLDEALWEHFSGCDEIWHAGDIGPASLVDELRAYKPLVAVYGNTDDTDIRSSCALDVLFEREGLRVWMIHIGASPPSYTVDLREALKRHKPDIFVCGHSHILRIERDRNGCLYLNPGAAGHRGHHFDRTALRFLLNDHQIKEMEVIKLGKRGQRGTQQSPAGA